MLSLQSHSEEPVGFTWKLALSSSASNPAKESTHSHYTKNNEQDERQTVSDAKLVRGTDWRSKQRQNYQQQRDKVEGLHCYQLLPQKNLNINMEDSSCTWFTRPVEAAGINPLVFSPMMSCALQQLCQYLPPMFFFSPQQRSCAFHVGGESCLKWA